MQSVYEALIGMVEAREVCEETDRLLAHLGAEMILRRGEGTAAREAAAYLADNPLVEPVDSTGSADADAEHGQNLAWERPVKRTGVAFCRPALRSHVAV